jgi:F-type H+-transporting ATPase subunit b
MLMAAVLAGGSIIDLDVTVLVQLAIFLALLLILKPLLFDPILAVLAERERATEGDVKEARQRQFEVEEKTKKYERELARIREKAGVEREKLRESGRLREREILEKARAEANRIVAEGREQMERESLVVRQAMEHEVSTISRVIVATVLEPKAGGKRERAIT